MRRGKLYLICARGVVGGERGDEQWSERQRNVLMLTEFGRSGKHEDSESRIKS